MAGKVYLVRWPEGIVKAGTTRAERHLDWTKTGAEVLAVVDRPDKASTFALEARLLALLEGSAQKAFVDGSDGARLLGRFGGWTECFVDVPGHVVERCLAVMMDGWPDGE